VTVTIKPMRFCHVPMVSAIEDAVYPTPWSINAFYNEIADNGYASYFVAMAEDRVVGYAGIWSVLDEAHITTLAVCPLWQHQGVGKLLLEHIIAHAAAKGATRMTLEVRVSNSSAQDLYKKYGFVACGIRPRYYNDEDAIIMWRDNLPDDDRENTAQESR
jgi:[ribosomal protein S18]-alanine N-acetyltransferase